MIRDSSILIISATAIIGIITLGVWSYSPAQVERKMIREYTEGITAKEAAVITREAPIGLYKRIDREIEEAAGSGHWEAIIPLGKFEDPSWINQLKDHYVEKGFVVEIQDRNLLIQ